MHEFVRLFMNDADWFVGTLFISVIVGVCLLGVILMMFIDYRK